MSQQRIVTVYRVVFWAILLFVLQQSLTPIPASVFHSIWDKWLHLIAWFGVSTSAYMAYGYQRQQYRIFIVIVIVAAIVECGQLMVAGRVFSGLDIVANTLGCALGWGVVKGLECVFSADTLYRICGLKRCN